MENKKIQWEFLLGIGMLIVAVAGINIPLFLHSDTKMTAAMKAINDEMKDFHSKLIAIEQRVK